MFENLFDYFRGLYERDDTHPALAFWAGKGIYLVDFLDKTSPISLVIPRGSLRAKIGIFDRPKYGGDKLSFSLIFRLPRDNKLAKPWGGTS